LEKDRGSGKKKVKEYGFFFRIVGSVFLRGREDGRKGGVVIWAVFRSVS